MWKLRHQAINDLWIIAPIILPITYPSLAHHRTGSTLWSLLLHTLVLCTWFHLTLPPLFRWLGFSLILQRRKLKLRKRSNLSQVSGLENLKPWSVLSPKCLYSTSKPAGFGHYPVSCIPHPGNVSTVAPSHQNTVDGRASEPRLQSSLAMEIKIPKS